MAESASIYHVREAHQPPGGRGFKKRRWQEAVEQSPECATLSRLIRSAVEAEIQGESGATGGTSDSPPNVGVGGLRTSLESLESTVNDVAEHVELLRKDIDAGGGVELRPVLQQTAPEPDDLREDRIGLSAGEIANKVDADVDEVSDTLARLYRDVPSVESIEKREQRVAGEDVRYTVYYREP